MNDRLSFLERYKGYRILIAPLNWGLGHATRCIPIIKSLETSNEVFIASDGLALQWLKDYFPQGKFFELPGYRITYSSKHMWVNAARQSPKIIHAISKERKVVEDIVTRNKIDLVISDHRLGIRSAKAKNIIIAHQLDIVHPSKILADFATKIQAKYINTFDELWIPDEEGKKSLSGALSNASLINIQKKRIGTLSRFENNAAPSTIKTFDLIAILSGPEPARTYFENKIVAVFSEMIDLRILIVRGSEVPSNRTVSYAHLSSVDVSYGNELKTLIQGSEAVLCRSGYTSLMDLKRLKRKAILVPTPGQPEQEYLGVFNSKKEGFVVLKESEITRNAVMNALSTLRINK